MAYTATATAAKPRRPITRTFSVYVKSMLTTKMPLKITEVGKNVKQNLEKRIVAKMEGRCIADGYIKSNSVEIASYSSGRVIGDLVVFGCKICHPVEGMLMTARAKTITKAGIHAEVEDEDGNIPVTIFVARDHHPLDSYFANIKEGAQIQIKVIGVRYELNDPYISVIAKLMEPKREPRFRGGETKENSTKEYSTKENNIRMVIGENLASDDDENE